MLSFKSDCRLNALDFYVIIIQRLTALSRGLVSKNSVFSMGGKVPFLAPHS